MFLTSGGVLKIGDFGFARSGVTGSPNGHLSPNACTLWYRAPEMLLGSCEYGAACDAWSAGAVIAELWHLRPLFRGRIAPEGDGPPVRPTERQTKGLRDPFAVLRLPSASMLRL